MTTVEIKAGATTRPNRLAKEALEGLETHESVCLTGLNWAINNTILAAELVKKKMPELHQKSVFESYEDTKLRYSITLMKEEPAQKDVWYQKPGLIVRKIEPREDTTPPKRNKRKSKKPTRQATGSSRESGSRRGDRETGSRRGDQETGSRRGDTISRRGRGRNQRINNKDTTPKSPQRNDKKGGKNSGPKKVDPKNSNVMRRSAYIRQKNPDDVRLDNEIYITATRGIKTHVTSAATILQAKTHDCVILKGSGFAVAKTLRLCDILRHGFEGLHSNIQFTCEAVPFTLRSDVEKIRTRSIPQVEICLSLDIKAVPPNNPGYQPPVDSSEIKPIEV